MKYIPKRYVDGRLYLVRHTWVAWPHKRCRFRRVSWALEIDLPPVAWDLWHRSIRAMDRAGMVAFQEVRT